MPSVWLQRKVFHPCDGGRLSLTMYFATVVCPTSMPSMRISPWIRGAPQRGFAMLTVSNELTYLQGCLRSATACSRFPAPIGPEAGAMPADHRFRFEDFQSFQHARSQTIQSRKHQAVNAIEGHSLRRLATEHIELVSKNQDFRLKPCSRPIRPNLSFRYTQVPRIS